jgi:hypothetical protein
VESGWRLSLASVESILVWIHLIVEVEEHTVAEIFTSEVRHVYDLKIGFCF